MSRADISARVSAILNERRNGAFIAANENYARASKDEKFRRAADAGIDAYDYCSFLEEISYYSGDGRQDRIWAYIDNMPISKAQKDALHLAAGYKESTLEKAPWNR